MRSLCYENQFSFILKLDLIIITNFALRLALKERLRRTRKWPIRINTLVARRHQIWTLSSVVGANSLQFKIVYVHEDFDFFAGDLYTRIKERNGTYFPEMVKLFCVF